MSFLFNGISEYFFFLRLFVCRRRARERFLLQHTFSARYAKARDENPLRSEGSTAYMRENGLFVYLYAHFGFWIFVAVPFGGVAWELRALQHLFLMRLLNVFEEIRHTC